MDLHVPRQKRHTDLKTTSIVWDLDCLYIFCWWLADLAHHNFVLLPCSSMYHAIFFLHPGLKILPRERLMEAVCRWRASQGGPPQAADDGRTGDEISGGKMHPGPDHLSTTTCQPVLSCPSFYTKSPSHPPVPEGAEEEPFALTSKLRKATTSLDEYCLGYNLPRGAPSSSCCSASATRSGSRLGARVLVPTTWPSGFPGKAMVCEPCAPA
ncbi:uncharacterized protein [Aegilops tauschii subsp. strangulata]|uniref:uncharacterized protein isoform X2 n=1 Tax=Aegilops tauschii subsp. strangulata TaxID=200361 RepID=UPI00098B33D4